MALNLRHLHIFREVARSKSISAAARSVHLSQPAVTQAVAGVERFFSAPLLLSAHQIHYELKAGMLVALPHPAGRVVRAIGLTMRRDWHPTACQQRLLELIRSRARALGSVDVR